jgi:hypothetical protein
MGLPVGVITGKTLHPAAKAFLLVRQVQPGINAASGGGVMIGSFVCGGEITINSADLGGRWLVYYPVLYIVTITLLVITGIG